MKRAGVVLVFLSLTTFVACGGSPPQKAPPTPGENENENESEKKDAAAPVTRKDAAPAPTTRDADITPATPDAGADPVADAAPAAEDATGGAPDSAAPSGDSGGGGTPVMEAKWSHTMCNFNMLMYPNIDKNMGKFPPGSCPPPETLPRPCGGNSKITVMKATSSGHETGYVHPPEYATDQYLMTRWSSPGNMATAWLSMDLGSEQTFKRLYLAWELAHAGDYDVVTSNDGTTWTMLKQVRGGNGYQDIVDVEGKARHIRINGLAKGRTDTGGATYGYSLFDVVICGERP